MNTISFYSFPEHYSYRSSESSCLDDVPTEVLPTPSPDVADLSVLLPGEIMDGDTQCKSHYGEAYRRCSQLRVNL